MEVLLVPQSSSGIPLTPVKFLTVYVYLLSRWHSLLLGHVPVFTPTCKFWCLWWWSMGSTLPERSYMLAAESGFWGYIVSDTDAWFFLDVFCSRISCISLWRSSWLGWADAQTRQFHLVLVGPFRSGHCCHASGHSGQLCQRSSPLRLAAMGGHNQPLLLRTTHVIFIFIVKPILFLSADFLY